MVEKSERLSEPVRNYPRYKLRELCGVSGRLQLSRGDGQLKNGAIGSGPHSAIGVPIDLERIERAVREILFAVGEDPDREGLRRTPNRVARSYAELLAGFRTDPTACLKTVFRENYSQIVLLRNIPFHSLCEHHLLPFTGHAHVAYLARGRVVGLSKIARLVESLSLRLQLQERLTEQIADGIMTGLDPRGVICVLEATHTCMTMRGVNKHGTSMATSAVRGDFERSSTTRSEAFALIYGSSRS